MGSSLSKCCSNDNNVVYDNDTSDPLLAGNPAPSYNSSKDNAKNSEPSFFQRVSARFSLGGTPRSIEQGLKTFPYPLSEAEKEVLLKNEIPASEIKKLSIGVDAGGMGIIHVAEWKGQKVAIKEASAHVISKEASTYALISPRPPPLDRFTQPAFSVNLVPFALKHPRSSLCIFPIPCLCPFLTSCMHP